MVAGALFAAGFMSFEFVSYHLSDSGTGRPQLDTVLSRALHRRGVIASLVLGKLYDRIGIWVVVADVCLSSLFFPLIFLGGFWIALAGLLLGGIRYATQDTSSRP